MTEAPTGTMETGLGKQTVQGYELEGMDLRLYFDTVERIRTNGKLLLVDRYGVYARDDSGAAVPIPFQALPSRKFIVDSAGRLWRFKATGEPKSSAVQQERGNVGGTGGAPRRNDAIEMWSGNWRKIKIGGEFRYIKNLIWCAISKGINQKPGISTIDFYVSTKGFRQPHAKPDNPTEEQIAVLSGQESEMAGFVFAKMHELAEEHGLDESVLQANAKHEPVGEEVAKAEQTQRSNKRDPDKT